MNSTEIGVSITCLLVGYWAISTVMNYAASKKPKSKSSDHSDHEHASPEQTPTDAWHAILEVSPNASVEEIQTAYKKMIKQYHPDKVATLGKEIRDLAESKSKEINGAYAEGLRIRGSRF
jgi:DnaJ like chaperone protein